MPNTNLSSNMSLPIPAVGIDPGPDYATNINNCLTLLDAHDHSPGRGVLITPSGLDINADLPINNNNLTEARSLRLQIQPSLLAGASDLACFYSVGVDAYFNDGSGNQIRLTQNGGVSGTPGSIANLVPPASAAYASSNSSFVFQSGSTTPANIDGASFILRNLTPSSFGLTLSPPTLSSDYTITLPALPGAQSFVTIDASGNMAAPAAIAGGITLSMLATAVAQALTPAGSILAYGGTSAPAGYLMCDGSSVLRSTYSALFAAIGTAYGTADGTHFNVPDLRGLFARGVDGIAGNDPDASSRTAANTGGNTGNNVGSYEADAIKSHDHPAGTESTLNTSASHQALDVPGATNLRLSSTGLFGGSETRPKNLYVNYIIKT